MLTYLPLIFICLGVIAIIAILASGYVKASPDTAYVISGPRKNPRFLIGKAGIKIPFIEKKDNLTLELIPITVSTAKPVPTLDYIDLSADAIANIKISSDPELLKLAAQNFLNRSSEYIGVVAREVLESNMREIIGSIDLKTLVNDRQAFSNKVKENAEPDLRKMGLEIVNFNAQNFSDELGAISNLGIDNLTKIKKEAAIAKAVNEKEISIAQAQARKEANDAQVQADFAIAEKNTELEIKKAELKRSADAEKARADAAYEIQAQEQRKSIEIATADADIAKQEKEIEIQDKEIAIKEKALDADVKKRADAEKYAAEKKIEAQFFADQKQADAEKIARERKAEADRYEEEQKAEAVKAKAIAEAEAMKAKSEAQKVAMENEAAGIRAKGEAEAEAIKAKALAEAEGILKKAEAQKEMGEASKMEMLFAILPEMVKNAAAPYEKVNSITMYGSDNQAALTRDIMQTVQQASDGLGIDLKNVVSGILGGFAANGLADNK